MKPACRRGAASGAGRRQHRRGVNSESGNAGVVFTGSTEVAAIDNRTLAPGRPDRAADRGNRRHQCMIVDATALPEQVADDVVTSAFRTAGQPAARFTPACSHKTMSPIA